MSSTQEELAVIAERMRGMQALIKLRDKDITKALQLQAAEYERRLQQLNHEAQRVANIQSQSVTSEKFEGYIKTQDTALDLALTSMNDKIEAATNRNAERIVTNNTAMDARITAMVEERSLLMSQINDSIQQLRDSVKALEAERRVRDEVRTEQRAVQTTNQFARNLLYAGISLIVVVLGFVWAIYVNVRP